MEDKKWFDETEFDDITISRFEELCEVAFALKEEISAAEDKVKKYKESLNKTQLKIMGYLEKNNKDSYKARVGTVYINRQLSVKVPKEPQDRESFFNYLKAKGVFEDLITVHSRTLNSFYRAEWDSSDSSSDFTIPGIGAPEVYETLRMRK